MGGDKPSTILVLGLKNYLEKNPTLSNRFVLYATNEVAPKLELILDKYKVEVIKCENFINVHDEATVMRKKPNSTLVVALKEVRDNKITTLISVSNTKAYITTAAVFLNKLFPDAKITLASTLPKKDGGEFFFLDAGARVNYQAEDFVSLAAYGIESAKILFNIKTPSVRLINVGSEKGKGDKLHVDADELLQARYPINYHGNIEPYLFMAHNDDVVLADGFSGNILAKGFEGGVQLMTVLIKELAKKNWINKLALLVLKSKIKKELFRYDYRSKGSAFIFGFERILFKAHGRSDPLSIENSIKTATQIIESRFIDKLKGNWKNKNE